MREFLIFVFLALGILGFSPAENFEQLYTFLWVITGIFTALILGVIGFAYWDRRIHQFPLKEIRCLV